MNGKQLKNSILQWAIQGKLVPQDPNDEPASVLLERIRAEKARLVKEGKIKKDKNESIIFRGDDNSHYEKFLATGEVKCIDDEIPFEIPRGWEWCRLGAIGSWGSGATPSKGHPEFYGGSIPWLTTGELNESYVFDTKVKVTEKALACCSLRKCATGDVLIAMYGATIGKVAIAGCELTTNQACCACTPYYNYNKYLFYFLMSNKLNFIKMGEGGAQPNISKEKIVATLCPLPPLNEQRRIVYVVESLIPKIEHFTTLQANLEELNASIFTKLRKSILQEAIQGRLVPQDPADEPASGLLARIREEKLRLFKEGKLKKKDITDSVIFKDEDNKYYERIDGNLLDINQEVPFDLPDSWVWARLSSVCNMYTGNSISEKDKSTYFTGVSGMQYIGTKDVRFDNSIDYMNGIAIPDIFLPNFKIAPSGSVLMCIEGGSAGRKVGQTDRDVCFGNKLCCFSSFGGYQRYLYYYIQSPSFVESFQKNKTGIIGGVSVNSLKNILIAIPPIKEQVRIAQHVAETLSCL